MNLENRKKIVRDTTLFWLVDNDVLLYIYRFCYWWLWLYARSGLIIPLRTVSNKSRSRLIIINWSCYFDQQINEPFTYSRFRALFTLSRRTTCAKDHGLSYRNHPQTNEEKIQSHGYGWLVRKAHGSLNSQPLFGSCPGSMAHSSLSGGTVEASGSSG